MSDRDVGPEDALQVAQRSLAKVGDLEQEVRELRDELDEVRSDLTAATLRLSEFDEDRDYDALTRDDKVGMVREHAFKRAEAAGGRTALHYDDVIWGVFDGEPSPSHAYKLMELAADARGFEHEDPAEGQQRLAVDAAEAKRGAAFLAANNAVRSEGGR